MAVPACLLAIGYPDTAPARPGANGHEIFIDIGA
jgi:hypothetical protein